MTTKKQRRANVAAKRAAFDASYRADGLAAQKRSHDRDAAKEFQAEQDARKRKAAHIIKNMGDKIQPGTGVAYSLTTHEREGGDVIVEHNMPDLKTVRVNDVQAKLIFKE